MSPDRGLARAQAEQQILFNVLRALIAVGAAIGVANGLIMTKGRVEPFIATFTVASITTAVTLLYTNDGPLPQPSVYCREIKSPG